MRKRPIFWLILFFVAQYSLAQNPLDDEKEVNLESWKNNDWTIIGDFSVSPISKKTTISNGNGTLFSNKKTELKNSQINNSFLMAFEFNLEANSDADLKINELNSIKLSQEGLGTISGPNSKIIPEMYAQRALGLWQKIEVSVEDAPNQPDFLLINYLKLNDVLIIQHQTILKPKTDQNHIAFALHKGGLAIKNLKIIEQKNYKPITLSNIVAEVWQEFNWDKISTEGYNSKVKTNINGLNYDFGQGLLNKNFIVKYDADLIIEKEGTYNFLIDISGKYKLLIDNKLITNFSEEFANRKRTNHKLSLSKGQHTIHLEYLKVWYKPALGIFVSGNGAKPYPLHELNSLPEAKQSGKILLNPVLNTEVIRGFYMHNGLKNTTAEGVGFTNKYSYTIDLEKGALLSIWKGNFANMTEMWYERGEPQTFEADGLKIDLQVIDQIIDMGNQPIGLSYVGQFMDNNNTPTFEYGNEAGLKLTKKIQASNQLLQVSININEPTNKKIAVIQGEKIERIEKNIYKSGQVYIKINDKLKPEILALNNKSLLVVPAASEIIYDLIW
jgi:hypothetical protein